MARRRGSGGVRTKRTTTRAAASPEAIAIAFERTFSNDPLYGSQPRVF